MAELRAGALALVVGGQKNEVLIGRTVELVRLVAAESMVKIPGQPLFWNEAPARWLITKKGLRVILSNKSVLQGFALISPQHLVPIDGDDFQHEDEQQKELTHG